MAILPCVLVIAKLLSFSSQISSETDTITQFQSLPDDGRTLVDVNRTFELGFFSPGSSTNRYVGMWFKNVSVKTVVWVANRDRPINDKSGELSISKEGNLVLLTKNGTVHWSTNATMKKSSTVIAQLLGSGNLVLRDEKYNDEEGYLWWQSFDYPTDTILPGMKLGWNLTSGLNRHLTAWKNWDDPSSGHLTYGFIRSDNPEQEMWNGSSMLYRSGPWNGIRFSATQKLKHRPLFNVEYVHNKDEYYSRYNPKYTSLISRIVINQTVYALRRLTWSEGNQRWKLYLNVPRDDCDDYGRCGSFGVCAMMGKSPACDCLSGFTPKFPQNWSQGCVRGGNWRCRENKDGFTKFQNLKVPDTKTSRIDRSMTLEECKAKCWENCSCTAYANSNIIGDGSGCILWFGDLLDLRLLPDSGQDIYVRLAASQLRKRNLQYIKLILLSFMFFKFLLLTIYNSFNFSVKQTEKQKVVQGK